ncbi:Membrane domain of glycerophosphoryl diester phosphodiesterase [Paenibacillus sp. UNCCL117]|uniref:glycerophosphoryl diester phosphodiesterase membrane domain-containing protein n=1 Tax=unclassified Paenibacillus TaxID=185978 RepID=UPI00087E46A4|nr:MULTISPECIES: glycerophosphoryl diester phosphodiesterase membrane domain-containing protein [unclassified Paenibacillus]SDD40282.1 Membrane domain of glycerophosphoryl diester phosphodiesterase [Paenibacillus sp. cl123]SFW48140.1 Membrane domain of glycerophosphoryl diester phosphodiesterase [Paenibacillus sp. UNCCL117]
METLNRPMGIGAILDKSFQLYRSHFTVAFLLLLLFAGPFYIIQNVLFYNLSTLSFFPESGTSIADSFELFLNGGAASAEEASPGLLLFTFLVMPLYLLLLVPVLMSSQLLLVKTALQGGEVRFGEVLRGAFVRYGRQVGNTLLYGLIIFGLMFVIWIALVLALVLIGSLTVGLGAGFLALGGDPFGGSIAFIVIVAVVYILTGFAISACSSYFIIRFGFYLPIVTLEDEGEAIRGSWRLTRGSFWRIFAVFFILTVIYTVFSLGVYALLIAVFKMSLIGQLINTVLILLIAPLYTIPYGVIYFDLRVRHEGADLERYMQTTAVPQQAWGTGGAGYADASAAPEDASAGRMPAGERAEQAAASSPASEPTKPQGAVPSDD